MAREVVAVAVVVVAEGVAVVTQEAVVAAVNRLINYTAKKKGVYIVWQAVGGWWPPVVVF